MLHCPSPFSEDPHDPCQSDRPDLSQTPKKKNRLLVQTSLPNVFFKWQYLAHVHLDLHVVSRELLVDLANIFLESVHRVVS